MPRLTSRRMLALLCLLSFVTAAVDAKPRKKTEDANLDINFLGVYSLPRQNLDSAMGVGLNVYYDRRLIPYMSLGINIGSAKYFGSPSKKAVYAELAGRLYPFRPTFRGELYLQGGAGIFFPSVNGIDNVGRRVHGTAALGFRKWMKGNKYINLALNYDVYSPRNRPTGNLGLKIGYGMRFGGLRTPGRYRKMTRSLAIKLGILNPDGTVSAYALSKGYKVHFAAKPGAPAARPVVAARPASAKPAVSAPVAAAPAKPPVVTKPAPVVAKPAPAKPAPVVAKPAPAKPAVSAPVAAAPAKPPVVAKPAPAKPPVSAPVVAAAPKPPVAAPPAPVAAAPAPAKKPAKGMFEMNFGSPAKPAVKSAGGAVNIDMGGGKSVAPASKSAAPINYTWVSGDSLTALAEAFFGDQSLYPILVDANMAKLQAPQNLKPGVSILIPRGVADAVKATARSKATQPFYLQWKTAGK